MIASASGGARRPSELGLPGWLEPEGLDLAGALAIDEYDAAVPAAWRHGRSWLGSRSAVLLASTGSRLFERFRETGRDSLDEHTRGLAVALAHQCDGRAFLYCDQQAGEFADFVALGLAAGLGARSRLGLLLHPEAGPWLAIRVLLLLRTAVEPTGPLVGFAGCSGCGAPCEAACPVAAPGAAGFRVEACSEHRRGGACGSRCEARRACPIGGSRAYAPAAEAWHQRAVAAFIAGTDSG